MATQTQIQNHSDLIDSILDDFDEFMESASKTLENKVAARILETNTVDELLALRIPLTEDYRTLVSERVREYIAEFDALAVDSIAMVGDGVTPLDNRVASELKAQAYARLDETTNQNKQTVTTEIVVGALAGLGVQQIAVNSRHAISGLMITVDDLETTRLQNRLRKLRVAGDSAKEEIAATLSQLKKRFEGVNVGTNLNSRMTDEMHDTVMDFDGVFVKHRARQAGLKKFRYSGTLIANSRDFCIRHVGKTYTEEEIKRIWSSESWSGKRAGDPFVVRGGERCRHFWIPVED
jgi:hypothetical protein